MNKRNKALGLWREKKVYHWVKNIWKWEIYKTNLVIDKYHALDFKCINSKGETCFIQVKGFSQRNKKISKKAIMFCKKTNAILYYAYVPDIIVVPPYFEKIDMEKFEENEW